MIALRFRRAGEALESLKQSRQAIDDLVSKDPANEFAKVWRASIATTQARAFAVWSGEPSASLSERQRRLAQAEIQLAGAEAWHRALKHKAGPVSGVNPVGGQ